ncbi:MAG: hypothetical protein EBT79_05535 [Actinobacteria bacterium]|nr:hypothetical protein [Actinomycetota bacterium]
MPCGFPAATDRRAQAHATAVDLTCVMGRIAPMLTMSSGLLLAGCVAISVDDPATGSVRRANPPAKETMVLSIRQLGPEPTGDVGQSADQATSDIIAVGFASITAQPGVDAAQRRLQAARAAKMDAYRNLAEQLYGVEFDSDSTVADTRVREDNIRVRVSGMIAGAEVVALEPLGNDSYQATIRLPAHKLAALRHR